MNLSLNKNLFFSGDVQYDNDGITPLMEAVGSGNVDHVDLLLKAGAKPGRIIFKTTSPKSDA